QLGYLPQQFGVYPNMSCIALLEHIAILKGLDRKERKQQISDLLVLLNLSQFASKKVSHFSGGMKQRFGIAQALLGDPKLIILDEPTRGLDVMSTRILRELLLLLKAQGHCVLFSSHVMQEVAALCDHVVIMANGQVIAQGSVAELCEQAGKETLEEAFVALIGSDEGIAA
ncbi:hypothetical protein LCGC14_3032490, partial [marine sediment metagenome]